MKIIVTLLLLTFISFSSFAQKWNELNEQGRQLRKEGKLQEAVTVLEKAQAEAEKKFGKNHKNYGIVLNNLALTYDDMRKFEKAEPLYKEALAIYKATVSEKDAFYVTTLENLGYLYQQQGKFKEAEEYYSQALAINKEIVGTKSAEYAASLENIAKLADKSGQKDKAEKLYIEHLNVQKDIVGEKHPSYATAMENLAKFYQNHGDFRLAENFFQDVLKVRKRNNGDKTPDYANTLNNLAILYKVSGKPDKAEATYEEALAIYKATVGDKSSSYATTVGNLANLYYSQAKYDKAAKMYEETRNIVKATVGDKHPDYATCLRDLAKIHYVKGEYALAEPLYIEAIAILKSKGTNNKEYVAIINDLSNLYRMQGNEQKSLPLLEESTRISKEVLGDKHPEYARALYNLALITYKREGSSPKVEDLYKQVVEICRANPADANLYGTSLNALANFYTNNGDFDKAEPFYKEAQKVTRQNLGKKHPAYARSVNNLAVLYRQRGKTEKALEMFKEVAEIRKEVLGTKHVEYARTLHSIADLYYLNKDYANAEPYYIEANRIFLEQIYKNFTSLSEKEKENYFRLFNHSFQKFNSFMLLRYKQNPKVIEEAYYNNLGIKGIMLSEQNRVRNTILNSQDSELIALYKEWQTKKDEIAQIYMKVSEEEIDMPKAISLETEIEDLEKKIALKSTSFAARTRHKAISYKEIQESLAEDEINIEMVRFNKYEYKFTDSVFYIAFVVSKNLTQPEIVIIPTNEEKEKGDLAFYRNNIRLRKADILSYDVFWKPIQDKIQAVNPNAKKIYFSADGLYYLINLNTLLNPQNKKYLTDEYKLYNVTSSRELVNSKNSAENRPSVSSAVLLGFPDFEIDEEDNTTSLIQTDTTQLKQEELEKISVFKQTISTLPGTKKEIESIEKLLVGKNARVEKLFSQKANEANLKKVKSPSILHIATHGYFMENEDPNEGEGVQNNTKPLNPLIRSGLLLAGSQKTLNKERKVKEDGIITAFEVQSLDLSNTDLVVASACETALGERKNGEGVFGLQRAFQVAGAKAVITSLWKVDDAATEMLMTAFYAKWLDGRSKYDALKEAQNEIRKKYPHPFYWGAFVLVENYEKR